MLDLFNPTTAGDSSTNLIRTVRGRGGSQTRDLEAQSSNTNPHATGDTPQPTQRTLPREPMYRDALGRTETVSEDSQHGWYLKPNNAKLRTLDKVQETLYNIESHVPIVMRVLDWTHDLTPSNTLVASRKRWLYASLILPFLVREHKNATLCEE